LQVEISLISYGLPETAIIALNELTKHRIVMKNINFAALGALFILAGCENQQSATQSLLEAQTEEAHTSSSSTNSSTRTMAVTVEPQRANCFGVAPMRCLIVNNELFYEDIQGFDFVTGNRYQLLIERQQAYTKENTPADASLYQYKLIKVLSRVPVNK
jgi:hypothetical protein